MKINYLILAHNNYEHLDRLIDSLDDRGAAFFVHIDLTADADYHNSKSNVFFVEDRKNIIWGGFSMVEATVELLKLARRTTGEGYYCLLSGADYPVCSNETIREELARGYERINIKAAPLPHKEMARFEYYHFNFNWRKLMTLSEKITRAIPRLFGIKREIPFKIYAGSQWFALSHECVSYILKEISENRAYFDFFRYVKIPDESFFQTVIGNSTFLQRTKPAVTYMDWSTDPAPALITERHVDHIRENRIMDSPYGSFRPMFARKFTDESKPILEEIDRTLRRD